MNRITLKWGSLKGWDVEDGAPLDAIKKWASFGHNMSAIMQHDTPEQKQALLDVIDHADEIWLDWEGKKVSRQEAKDYVINYGQK